MILPSVFRICAYVCLLSLSSTILAAPLSESEFEELRQNIRSAYAENPATAIAFTDTVLKTKELTLEQQIKVLNYKAWFQLETDQLEEAIRTLVTYKAMTLRSSDPSLMYGYYNISGGIYSKLALYEQALNYFLQALEQANMRKVELVHQTENNIGEVYLALHKFDEAEQAFTQYYEYTKPLNKPLDFSIAMTNLVKVMLAKQQYPAAKELLERAITLQQNNQFDYHLAWSYQLLGQIERETENYQSSVHYLQQAISLLTSSGTPIELINAKLSLAKTYHEMGQTTQALQLTNEIQQQATQLKNLSLTATVSEFSASLSESLGNFKAALVAYKQFNQSRQALLLRQSNVNLAKALAEVDMASKELQIANLTKEQQVKATQAKAFKELALAIAISLMIILFGSMYAIRSIYNQKQALANTLEALTNTQSHLIEVEKMASLTALVSGMAHQLNTPIGTIVTASSFIQDNLQSLEQKFNDKKLSPSDFNLFIQQSNTAKDLVISNINRLAKMVEEFKALNVSIALDKPMSKIKLRSFIVERMDTLQGYLSKDIRFEYSGAELSITSYPSIIGDVLKTLVINAYEHGFKDTENAIINIDIKEQNEQVMIVFQDNGSGIDNAILKDIFTPFYSTNPGGNHLGLGLNVVFNAVKYNLFGNICAEPCQHGARFVIALPIDGPQAAKQRDEA